MTMEKILRQAGERSPFVDFDFPNHRLLMEGESYPEDAAAFFGPLLEALAAYLNQSVDDELVFDLRLTYFNSSSAKALMNIFQMLEGAADAGRPVVVNWHFHPDDDTMEEFGEDFSQDFVAVIFRMCPVGE